MVEGILELPEIDALDPAAVVDTPFDIGIWAAGYEARSRWLVTSAYRPRSVGSWWRVEFEEHRDAIDAPTSLQVDLGAVVGGTCGHRNWDGYWRKLWRKTLDEEFKRVGRPLTIFVDYSSMPRTVYGTLLLEALRDSRTKVREIAAAYVPGQYGADIEGSRRVLALRALIGTEGLREEYDKAAAFVIGVGFDAQLAEAVIELYQVDHFSCFYADPGVPSSAAERVRRVNEYLLSRSERVVTAPLGSVRQALMIILKLCDWYLDSRPVVLVPLGPKPHVLAGILAAVFQRQIAFRWVTTSWERPVQVRAAPDAVPNITSVLIDS